ncbi:MAG: bifunctional 5,10-methylenetetrahydrofolate dehydrogenase/5,10-methenyltetrahydrofolate cyclohydrolase [Candidatus Eremiobacteraeota bacterium]|nr:bifunctional 5,10-methylenetetrahydrofolate dehydrogenase/5,10-methenyltetrahydrofolate cyclohydrolase [Candidatus Eremiobacteraeota bacterium]
MIDGRSVAADITADVRARVDRLLGGGIVPRCTIIVAQGDDAGLLYARATQRNGDKIGIGCDIVELAEDSPSAAAESTVRRASCDPQTHGILIQRPLPTRFDEPRLSAAIAPRKDVDGANPLTCGLLMSGSPTFVPATAAAVMELLRRPFLPPIRSAHAVVVGRSHVAGRPIAALLTAADATVTLCHSFSRDIHALCRLADIVIVAVGRPGFLTSDMVKPGATVIDVGTNVENGRVRGDVDAAVSQVASALTPVPGGVGPVTAAMLLRNVVEAAEGYDPK